MESYQHDPKHAANTNNASRRRPLPQDTTQLITESFTEHANNKDSHLTVLCALYLPVLGLPRRETGESRQEPPPQDLYGRWRHGRHRHLGPAAACQLYGLRCTLNARPNALICRREGDSSKPDAVDAWAG
jgi:hypothetical protein